jgi:hypothetical protein
VELGSEGVDRFAWSAWWPFLHPLLGACGLLHVIRGGGGRCCYGWLLPSVERERYLVPLCLVFSICLILCGCVCPGTVRACSMDVLSDAFPVACCCRLLASVVSRARVVSDVHPVGCISCVVLSVDALF